jgi:hypothetical protein
MLVLFASTDLLTSPLHPARAAIPPGNGPCEVGFFVDPICVAGISAESHPQTFTVPDGVDTLNIQAVGGWGGGFCSPGNGGGRAGGADGDLAVTPGEKLAILVGRAGANESSYATGQCVAGQAPGDGAGGFGGGGDGGGGRGNGGGAGGGGGTFVLAPGGAIEFAAGGGGGIAQLGGGAGSAGNGGSGGGAPGGNSPPNGTGGGTDGFGGGDGQPAGGGGGASQAAGGAGGVVGPPSSGPTGSVTAIPGDAGTGPTTGASLAQGGKGGGTCVFTPSNPDNDPFDFWGGGGGGGYYGGGGGGCQAHSGGGGGGSSFVAANVTSPSFQPTASVFSSNGIPEFTDGIVDIRYTPPCPDPLKIEDNTAVRTTQSGDLTVGFHGRVNPVDKCGDAILTVIHHATGQASRSAVDVDVPLTQITKREATATRQLTSADSCWSGAMVRLEQGTGTTKQVVKEHVDVTPDPTFETATARRTKNGVDVEVKVIGLPPQHACRQATVEVDGIEFTRLRNPQLDPSGGVLTGTAVRQPSKDDCKSHMHFAVIPRPGEGGTARAVREITGQPAHVLQICRKS